MMANLVIDFDLRIIVVVFVNHKQRLLTVASVLNRIVHGYIMLHDS